MTEQEADVLKKLMYALSDFPLPWASSPKEPPEHYVERINLWYARHAIPAIDAGNALRRLQTDANND